MEAIENYLKSSGCGFRNGIWFAPDAFVAAEFSDAYFSLREKEGRIVSDALLAQLPSVPANHPHAAEWKMRADSAGQFCKYVLSQNRDLRILDLGCGNGWMSAMLSRLPGVSVVGLEVNVRELEQAARVFGSGNENLVFVCGDIFKNIFPGDYFDLVLMSASVQYFPDLEKLFVQLKKYMKPGAEIHILDSPFYPPAGIEAAKLRTANYYSKMGFPEMANHYFHHDAEMLKRLGSIAMNEKTFIAKALNKLGIGKKVSPFTWWMLR